MRVVFLCTSSLDYPSPRGRWLPIARELVRAGHHAQLLMLHPTFGRLGPGAASSTLDGVATCYVGQMHVYGMPGARRVPGATELLRVSLRGAQALAAAAVRLRPDVLVVAKPQPINGLAGFMVQRLLGCRLHVDCDDYESGANRFASAWQRIVVAWWEHALPRHAEAVTVNTRFLLDYHRTRGVALERLHYVPNGISDAQFKRPAPDRRIALQNALGLSGHPTLLYLGAMSTVAHGVGLLLEAFQRALISMPQARLLLVGEGDERAALMSAAHERGLAGALHWLGAVPAEAARAYLALAQASIDPVFATPTMAARSPLKVVESMAQGVPVITGDVGDRREVLGASGGLLVPPGDAGALAEAIVALLGDTELQHSLALGARRRAEAYRWERLAVPWVALYAPA